MRADVVVSTVQAYGYGAAFLFQVGVGVLVARRVRNRAGRLLTALFLLNGMVSLFYLVRVFVGDEFGRPAGGRPLEAWFDAPTGPILAALAWELRRAEPARSFGGSEGIVLAIAGLQFLLITFPPNGWTGWAADSLPIHIPNFLGYAAVLFVAPGFGSRGTSAWMPRPEWIAASLLMRPVEITLREANWLPQGWAHPPGPLVLLVLETAAIMALIVGLVFALVHVARRFVLGRALRPHTQIIPLLFLGGLLLGTFNLVGTYGPRLAVAQDLVNTSSLFFVRPLGTVVAVFEPRVGARIQRSLLAFLVGVGVAAGTALLFGGTTAGVFLASLPVGAAAAALFVAFAPALRSLGKGTGPTPVATGATAEAPRSRPRGLEVERLGAGAATLIEEHERNAAEVRRLPTKTAERLSALTRRDRLLLCLRAAGELGEGEVFASTYAGVHFYTHIPYNDVGTLVDRTNERGAQLLRDLGLPSPQGPVRLIEKRRGARKYYLLTEAGRRAADALRAGVPGLEGDPHAWVNHLGEGHFTTSRQESTETT